ncbi:MAG: ABC transporter substrate-binding protein, partial [Rhodospirillaceae bacterium]|nr:ABC transporter substrate-binding protein [Rhodospirillaceae bacterium]
MNRLALSIAAIAVCSLALTVPTYAQNAVPRHGISVFGDLKYPAGFSHFGYVNPNAPKGGTLKVPG